jgi:hypothetical protein
VDCCYRQRRSHRATTRFHARRPPLLGLGDLDLRARLASPARLCTARRRRTGFAAARWDNLHKCRRAAVRAPPCRARFPRHSSNNPAPPSPPAGALVVAGAGVRSRLSGVTSPARHAPAAGRISLPEALEQLGCTASARAPADSPPSGGRAKHAVGPPLEQPAADRRALSAASAFVRCALSAAPARADDRSRRVVHVSDGVDHGLLSRHDGRHGQPERFDPADEVAP